MNTYFKSSIFRKVLAALSGLFLVMFLIGHLVGNLQLFIPGVEGQTQFNKYAFFMTTNPIVKILSIITYSSIILHIFLTLFLTIQSKKARPIQYAIQSSNENSTWISKNMALLGVFILIFIIIHMKSFWYKMHFGNMPFQVLNDGTTLKDLYTVTVSSFSSPLYTGFYVLSMGILGMHLKHGIESSFQTLGIKVRKYEKILKSISLGVSLFIPAVFASIPVYIFIKQL